MTQMEFSGLQKLVPELMEALRRIEANSDKFEKRLDSLETGFGMGSNSAESNIDTSFSTNAEQVGSPEESVELLDTTEERRPCGPGEIFLGVFFLCLALLVPFVFLRLLYILFFG
ncbi:unnamed protein product [Clonostachys rhizophaga]|uniref:Uncharacterized protein n=1 Tax=Clonostachys rhizophaga TaxID=160324 RepID=A0A9N9VL39_9HYPO|nr:unnamed protein product [Clonostachys rhizophaga]